MYLRFNKIISFLYQGHLKVKLAFFFYMECMAVKNMTPVTVCCL